ncbi:nitrogenase molybdenum-iron cofactor biosynthesis protein NifUQ [Syntrophotalea carbinolica DSM 2380]|uniref:Nitrogenase molybdenum-iron cofactor biosynthesis protein NifUQ n=1 Tax=Syntrophotalea carbinolica (strain DSM 2380 / NBRC 103641 / GraBd1) TaxID=338963 RepID=Q3A7R9_SYNC1|nr:nitrogen fixation protein NifQ [Syntrophotalea carbinolica]ABA87575.1 nitrogenase molybdenum-iron cofactor biosynthesis protein NifUQ [Syntrophotalea carbinolica DSM 2380]
MLLYTDTIRRWATDYRRCRDLTDPHGTGEVGMAHGEEGTRIAVRFTVHLQGALITDVGYQVFGCGYSMAACAAAAELACNKNLPSAMAIDASQVDALLDGLPPERSYCADLAVEALQAALASASGDAQTVQAAYHPAEEEHGPRVHADHPVYRALMDSTPVEGSSEENRHLFACLLSVAADEPYDTAAALGLSADDLKVLLETWFPECSPGLFSQADRSEQVPPEYNDEVLQILLTHVPREANGTLQTSSLLLARIIAARTAYPGHLWVAMGLFERPQLSASIRRLLPSLAAANNQNMRWKRYLFKQVCDLNGGMMCKSPNCGDCSDYAICFPED